MGNSLMKPMAYSPIAVFLTLLAVSNAAVVMPVFATSEFAPYAERLAQDHIIAFQDSESGYRFGESLTRAEMAKIALKLSSNEPKPCSSNVFYDVTVSLWDLCWFVESAADAGLIRKNIGYFYPLHPVSRAEMVKMLATAKKIGPSGDSAGFSDVDATLGDLEWYINAGVALGCIKKGSTFQPNRSASRWEAFKIAVCMAGMNLTPPPASGSGITNPSSNWLWNLVWSDEFNGESLDQSKWTAETGADGWGNDELQNYTSDGNFSVGSGFLTIEARHERSDGANYSSARLMTHKKASWTYGKIEARIRLPYGKGIWPAFWLLGENIDQVDYPACGEIDIMELAWGKEQDSGDVINNDAIVWGSIHRPNLDRNPRSEVKSFSESFENPNRQNFSDAFHVFGIEWNEKNVIYSVDGKTYQTVDIASNSDGYDVFHKPFYIILNLAIGGNWPGTPDSTTVWPQKMVVDWVRVYQENNP